MLIKSSLCRYTAAHTRQQTGEFLFAVDHCFPIKGQGTVLTGTVLSGECKVRVGYHF